QPRTPIDIASRRFRGLTRLCFSRTSVAHLVLAEEISRLVFYQKSFNFSPWHFRLPLTLKPLWNWLVTTSWRTARLQAKSPNSRVWPRSANRFANAKANCVRRLRIGFLSG